MVEAKEIYDYLLNELKPERFSDEERKAVYKKATTMFKAGDKQLVFVGGVHVGTGDPFIDFLENVFDTVHPDFLLLERSRSDSEENLSTSIQKLPKEAWREPDWAMHFAKESKIHFAGMDITFEEFFIPFAELGEDRMKMSVFFWFLLQYYTIRPARSISSEDAYQLAKSQVVTDFVMPAGRFFPFLNKEFMEMCKRGKASTIHGVLDEVFKEMTDKYLEKAPLLSLIDKTHLSAPFPFNNSYELNKIAALWTAHRDKIMIDACIRALKEHNKVIALAGNGHIQETRALLEKEMERNFGVCEVKRWDNKGG